MADERDPKVSQRYRELGSEEPPRHVEEAILAASRRAVRVRPAPLVPPTGRRRWYFPLAAAAVIMLSVAVTWHMQVERPDPDGYVASAPAPAAEPRKERKAVEEQEPVASPPPAAAAKAFTPDPPRESRDRVLRDAPARAAPQAPPPPVAGARAPEAARADRVFGKLSEQTIEPPEKWLERIAELRREGKHEEADKALEEFRKRYPGYKVPEAALGK